MSIRLFKHITIAVITLGIMYILLITQINNHPAFASILSRHRIFLPYNSGLYFYKQVPHNGDPLFQDLQIPPVRTVNNGFEIGYAPFGYADPSISCPIYNNKRTTWQQNTDMLVAHTIIVPPHTSNVKVHVMIDNDAVVYWNTHEIGSTTHDGCVTEQDAYTVTVPEEYVKTENTLAIRGIDRGLSTYLDAEVDGDVALIPILPF